MKRHLCVGRIEPDQGLPGLDEIGVIGPNGDHGRRDLRGDLHRVATDVGIVGVFNVAQVEPPIDAIADAGDDKYTRQHSKPEFALGLQ